MRESVLIEPLDLQSGLSSAEPPTVLDVRWSLAGPQVSEYQAGHVPGARFVDLDRDLSAPPGSGGRHPLPSPEELQATFRRLGIRADRPVVAYDGANSSVAARAWWLLRWAGHPDVRVLDGGWRAWSDAGLPTEDGPAAPAEEGDFRVRPGAMPVADIDQIVAADSQTPSVVLLDARAPERYRGEVEPIDPVAGHIPGAINLPLTELVDDAGRFLSDEQIRERLHRAGAHAAASVIASCGSGVTACHLILAGAVIGRELTLYPGSYSGWCAAGREVVAGAEALGGERRPSRLTGAPTD